MMNYSETFFSRVVVVIGTEKRSCYALYIGVRVARVIDLFSTSTTLLKRKCTHIGGARIITYNTSLLNVKLS